MAISKTIGIVAALATAAGLGWLEGRRLRTLELRTLELYMEQFKRLQEERRQWQTGKTSQRTE